jgi:hypothetical protein
LIITVGLTTTATGEKLEPLVIIKGETDGRIYRIECRPYNNKREFRGAYIMTEPNAWIAD